MPNPAAMDHPSPGELSPDKEAAILAGAAAVFARDGYGGASMSRIAAAAQVSKGTLYNYFPSKAALFGVFVQRRCRETLTHAIDDLEGALPVDQVLRLVGRRLVAMLVSEPGLTIYRVVVAESHRFPELAESFYAAGPGQGIARLAALLRDAGLGGTDPLFAAEQLVALMQTEIVTKRRLGLVTHITEDAIGHVVDAAVDLFLHGRRGA